MAKSDCGGLSKAQETATQPVVVSARMENGTPTYRVNGKKVEDSRKKNSLLKNFGNIVEKHGTEIPVFSIIDVRASFGEVGKLETALLKLA